MYESVAHLGISYWMGWSIVNAIMAGFTIASIVAMFSGVASWIGLFYNAIKKKIWDLGAAAAVAW